MGEPNRKLHVSTFKGGATDKIPREKDLDWPTLLKRITKIQVAVTDKRHTPGFSFAEYNGHKLRENDNVTQVHGLIYDIDNETTVKAPGKKARKVRVENPLLPEDVCPALDQDETAYAFYSTFSSTADHPKWRLVIPLDEPVQASDYKRVYKQVAEQLGITYDRQCSDPARLFFLPYTHQVDDAFAGGSEGSTFYATPPAIAEEPGADPSSSTDGLSQSEEAWLLGNHREFDADLAAGMLEVLDPDVPGSDVDSAYAWWVKIIMALHYQSAGSDEGYELAAEWSQRSEHWDEAELQAKWDSFDPKVQSVTIATVRHYAKEHGWQPQPKLFTDFAFRPIGQVLNIAEPPPPPVWAINGLARERHVGLLTGTAGIGKSWLLLDLACNLCTGTPFLGMLTRQSHVVYMNAEDNLEIIHERLFARFEHQRALAEMAEVDSDLGIPDIQHRLSYLCTSELSKVVRFTDSDGNLQEKMAQILVQRLLQVRERAGGEPVFLIMDPLAAYNGGEENSNTDMSVFVNFMRSIVAKTGVTLLLCHHDRKGISGETDVGDMSGRGASAIYGGVRWGMRIRNTWPGELADFGIVEDNAESIRREYGAIEFTKANYAQRQAPIVFRRGQGGVLVPQQRVDMGQQIRDFRNRYGEAMDHFLEWLGTRATPPTWRDLRNNRRLRNMAFGIEVTRETAEEIVQILEVEGHIVNNRGIRVSD